MNIPVTEPQAIPLMFGVTDRPPHSVSGASLRVSFHNGKPVLMMGYMTEYVSDPDTLDRLIAGLIEARNLMANRQ